MKHWKLLIIATTALQGCASWNDEVEPFAGMTLQQFEADCRTRNWKVASVWQLSDEVQVANCEGNQQVFTSGVLDHVYVRQEVLGITDDHQCRSLGLEVGEDGYVNCRLSIAQTRAGVEAMQAQQEAIRQAIALSALAQNMRAQAAERAARTPAEVHVTANCTANRVGNTVYYHCF